MTYTKATGRTSSISAYVHTKTLLFCYKHLKKYYATLVRDLSERSALGYDVMHNMTTEALIESTIDLNHRIEGVINIKVLVERALSNVPEIYCNILVKRHIKAMDAEAIAESLGISVRTYYRKYSTALRLATEYLDSIGYTEDRLESEYGEDNLYKKMYTFVTSNLTWISHS